MIRPLLTLAACLPAATAIAGEIHMRVTEVYLAHPVQGTSVQYVELRDDNANADYPSPLIQLVIYNELGNLAGSVPLETSLVIANRQSLIVASAGFSTVFPATTVHATFGFVLPASGQACFENANGVVACLAWGNPVPGEEGSFSDASGPAPPAGQALALDDDGMTTFIAPPTPGMANPDPATLPDAGVGPDAGLGTPDDPPGTIDAGQPPGGNATGGGCDCRAAASGTPSPLVTALLGLALWVGVRRRRR